MLVCILLDTFVLILLATIAIIVFMYWRSKNKNEKYIGKGLPAIRSTKIHYPDHWGEPPIINNINSWVELPNGYGLGPKQLSDWIEKNIKLDKKLPVHHYNLPNAKCCLTR